MSCLHNNAPPTCSRIRRVMDSPFLGFLFLFDFDFVPGPAERKPVLPAGPSQHPRRRAAGTILRNLQSNLQTKQTISLFPSVVLCGHATRVTNAPRVGGARFIRTRPPAQHVACVDGFSSFVNLRGRQVSSPALFFFFFFPLSLSLSLLTRANEKDLMIKQGKFRVHSAPYRRGPSPDDWPYYGRSSLSALCVRAQQGNNNRRACSNSLVTVCVSVPLLSREREPMLY